jgi:sodium/potassium-transporting ATPase subunit alpha
VPVFTNAYLGMPLPLSAFQMIVICVLTDVSPALSLMLEKPEKDLLRIPPRSKNDHLVNWQLIFQAFCFIGILQAFLSHFAFVLYLKWYGDFKLSEILLVFDKWTEGYKGYTKAQLNEFLFTGQTITFTTLVIMQIFGNIFCTRTNFRSFFERPPFIKISYNPWIFLSQIVSLFILMGIIFIPFVNTFFNTRPIPFEFFLIPILFCGVIFIFDEFRKLFVRNKILWFHKFAW